MTSAQSTRRIGRRLAPLNLSLGGRCLAGRERSPDVTDPVTWGHAGRPILRGGRS